MKANEGPRKLGPTTSLPSDMRPTSEPPSVCREFAVKKANGEVEVSPSPD